jgi:hypothetical protein
MQNEKLTKFLEDNCNDCIYYKSNDIDECEIYQGLYGKFYCKGKQEKEN